MQSLPLRDMHHGQRIQHAAARRQHAAGVGDGRRSPRGSLGCDGEEEEARAACRAEGCGTEEI